MSEDFDHLNKEEKLKAENDFLKMKLMLEHGAVFGEPGNKDLPGEVENEFLNNITMFEEQFKSQKQITVFDKIGRPQNFKPVAEIADEDIADAYKSVLYILHQHGINLDACSPNVTIKELYRFVVEELFEHETNDVNVPGWTTNFIYDEFHPDPIYENTGIAIDYCIRQIFDKYPMDWTHHLKKEGVDFNQHLGLSRDGFKKLVTHFQEAYDTLTLAKIDDATCTLSEGVCTIKGSYQLTATVDAETINITGKWNINMQQGGKWNYWDIIAISITNIDF